MSLGNQLQTRANGLNALRLVFALAVIVSHSWPISGHPVEPSVGDMKLGTLAVAGFFVISGYLISQSRDRLAPTQYLWRRARRIYPGYWVCLVVTAAVFAPLVGIIQGGWTPGSSVSYVLNNFLMVRDQGRIGETLSDAPFPLVWNGSLWTLKHEVLSYLVICVAYSVPWFRKGRSSSLLLFLVATAGSVGAQSLDAPVLATNFALLFSFFAAGNLLYSARWRVPVRWELAAAAVAVFAVTASTGTARLLSALPLAYLCFYLSLVMPELLKRVGSKNDISYGMYLYAFPLQQLVSATGLTGANPYLLAVTATACTTPVAWASWLLVEKRSLRAPLPRLHRRRAQPPRPTESDDHEPSGHRPDDRADARQSPAVARPRT